MTDHSVPIRTAASAVERAILQAVAYADIFDYPLSAAEVHRYLVGVPARRETVDRWLQELVRAGRLRCREDHYTLPGRESLLEVRRRRARVAARLWPEGIRYGRVIAQLPFVRMVAVTGALAVDNVEAGSDIDYMVVTVAGRVWIGRGMASLCRRLVLRRGVRLCPNFVVSEESLVMEERNLYTAHELLQMVPISGHAVHRRLLALNSWTREFLPNGRAEARRAGPGDFRRRRVSRLAEAALTTPLGDWLDRRERARLVRKMVPRAPSLAEVVYSADCCKDHVHGHGQRILAAFSERLRAAEVEVG